MYQLFVDIKDRVDDAYKKRELSEVTAAIQEARVLLNEESNNKPYSRFIDAGLLDDVLMFMTYDGGTFARLRSESIW